MTTRFAFYCTCGSSMVGEVSPASKLAGLEAAFDTLHNGAGHSRADQRTAANARRRQERAEERELLRQRREVVR